MATKLQKMAKVARSCALAVCAYAGFAGAAGVAQGPALAMLDRLEPGMWEISPHGAQSNSAQVCIDSGRKLIQIRHARESCRRHVIEDTPKSVVVHYTCLAGGYGQTSVRFENERLVQVETQGIDNGLPFNFTAEARRSGTCGR